jgi:hypothetical protein
VFQNNQSQANGGGLSSGNSVLVVNSQFINNTAQGDGTLGAGAIGASLDITAINSQFTGNTATTSPGGALMALRGLNLSHSTFEDNSAANGDGGAAFSGGPASIANSTFRTNASGGDGGALFISGTLHLSNSLLIDNVAHEGGGLYQAAGDGLVVNTLFARNVALDAAGMAMHLLPTGTLQILYTTVAAPQLSNGDAIRIDSGNVVIKNTLVTSHTIGLSRFGGSVFEDNNLFFGNSIAKFGTTTGGTHDTSGDPAFVNPTGDNYHVSVNSAALDAGTDVGVSADFDGQTRPQGAGFDIGFDEVFTARVYLPLVLR